MQVEVSHQVKALEESLGLSLLHHLNGAKQTLKPVH